METATAKSPPPTRDWGRTDDAGSPFSGIGRGKRGGPTRGPGRGRGAGRGGASSRGRGGRGRGGTGAVTASSSTATTVSTTSKSSETASSTSTSKTSKTSDTTPKTTPTKPAGSARPGARRRSTAKNIPQITVPPPTTTSTSITDEINALVEHVRAGALTPSGPITPFTPSHIDWAGVDDDDGSLPDLDDWGVKTTSTSDAISPILVEGLKSLPEPKVPEGSEVESATPPDPLRSKPESPVPSVPAASSSSFLHPPLPSKSRAKPSKLVSSAPRPPRNPRVNGKNTIAQPGPGPEPSSAKNNNKPVSGGVSLSTPSIGPATTLTPPDSPRKGLTESIHAPPALASAPAPKSAGSYVPPHTRNPRSNFVPTPAPPPSSNDTLTAEFTFPSLSPSPISGHYPTGPRGPGAGPVSASSGTDNNVRPNGRINPHHNNHNGYGNGRNGFNPRNNAPRHFHNQNGQNNNFSGPVPASAPVTSTSISPPVHDRERTYTPRHSPHHSREHSASRPVITGDAISKLARTIAGSPAKG